MGPARPFSASTRAPATSSRGKFDLDDVAGQQSVYTYGGSARVVLHHNMPVPQSVDFTALSERPDGADGPLRAREVQRARGRLERERRGGRLEQHLKNFDVVGQTKDQGSVRGRAPGGRPRRVLARFSATGIARDLNYVVKNVPGFIPFETMPKDASSTSPRSSARSRPSYYFPELRLTPGIAGGVQLPSTFQSEFTGGGLPASRTIVVRAQGDESILPYDDGRRPIFQARVSLKWEICREMLKRDGIWIQYIRDNNGTLVVVDPSEGTASLRVLRRAADRLGAAVSLQARF
jgi:hypothetical protein